MAKTAVVILNYNGSKYLQQFLPALIEHTRDAAIIVADNASTDDSIKTLKEFEQIDVIQLDKNYGFAGGYNEALKKVEADYYVLLNSDIEVTANWLKPLIVFLEKNDSYGACQPKILSYHEKDSFEHAGASGGFLDVLGYPYCRGRIFNNLEKDVGQYNEPVDVLWATGACMVIRSSVFWDLGGFDSGFFAHMEEIDLCWRAQARDVKLKCIPTSHVYHVGGGTLANSSPFKTYLNFRNNWFLLLKNLPLRSLIWKVPLRIVLDWLSVINFGLSSGIKHSGAILKAHWHVLLNLGKTLKKRSKPTKDITTPISIVIGNYLKGKRKFSDY